MTSTEYRLTEAGRTALARDLMVVDRDPGNGVRLRTLDDEASVFVPESWIEPAPEVVTLPWNVISETRHELSIAVHSAGEVFVLAMDRRTSYGQPVGLTPAQARSAATALILAAEVAERAS